MKDLATPTRSAEILDSVKSVFAAKGFEGASMQDLARAAGMSAGNFYRYFPSKDAIIEAIVERELERVADEFTVVMDSDAPAATLKDIVRRRLDEPDDCRIFAEIEAASLRRPELAQLLAQMEEGVVSHLISIFARIFGLTDAQAEARFRPHAHMIVMIVQGLAKHSQCRSTGQVAFTEPRLEDLALSIIDSLLGGLGPVAGDDDGVPLQTRG